MMDQQNAVYDVFKTQGQPTVTYVERAGGHFEKQLAHHLDSRGILCLLTGASKTGKTTLYTKVAKDRGLELLRIRCHAGLSTSEFWKQALEKINFDRLTEVQRQKGREVSAGGKLSGSIGWKWLAGLLGEVGTEISSASSEAEVRTKILAEPSPDHLIPVLQRLPVLLVVEDFHYLDPAVQKIVFQQWKAFVDNEISVIVVGTTHHAADLAYSNKDLLGRVAQIDLPTWQFDDLREIATLGFTYMGVRAPTSIVTTMANESVGLPIVMQSVCLQLLTNRAIYEALAGSEEIAFEQKEAYRALHQVAVEKYGVLATIYDRLARGPRKRARKYNTYELILSCFQLNPLTFSLTRGEILERLKRLPQLPMLEAGTPPAGSVTSTLSALSAFQQRMGVELLEWSERDQRLYILEPSFLFFLRWRTEKEKPPTLLETIMELLEATLRRTPAPALSLPERESHGSDTDITGPPERTSS